MNITTIGWVGPAQPYELSANAFDIRRASTLRAVFLVVEPAR